jgi:hypothetical protein
MHEQPDEALATAFFRAIQALEKMLATLHRSARAAAGLRQIDIARRLDELARDAEHSLQSLRSVAAANHWTSTSRRNGR